MRALFLSITALLIFALAPAEARHYRHGHVAAVASVCSNTDIMRPCATVAAAPERLDFRGKITDRRGRLVRYTPAPASFAAPVTRVAAAVSGAVSQMLPHPAGCPARLFCGCGAAVEIFGTPRRDLWLAAAWGKFPRAAPAPNMAAYRSGHVFVLKQEVAPDQWLVADYNSGGHASRLHVRSLRGYTVVNPRA